MNSYTLTITLTNGQVKIQQIKSREDKAKRVVVKEEPRLQKKYGYQIARIHAERDND